VLTNRNYLEIIFTTAEKKQFVDGNESSVVKGPTLSRPHQASKSQGKKTKSFTPQKAGISGHCFTVALAKIAKLSGLQLLYFRHYKNLIPVMKCKPNTSSRIHIRLKCNTEH
jgi:hypothetical protein